MPRKRGKNVKKTIFIEEEEEEPNDEEVIDKKTTDQSKENEEIIDEDITIQTEEDEEIIDEETTTQTEGDEEVWDAVEWEEMGPMESEAVFNDDTFAEILKNAVDQAWKDGIITTDEMAILQVLKSKLKIDDETFDWIINERKPDNTPQSIEEITRDVKIEVIEEEDDDDEEEEEEEDDVEESEDEDDWEEDEPQDDVIQGQVMDGEIQYFRKNEVDIPPKAPISDPPPMSPPPKPPDMITFSHSVRGESRPLDRSFDLTKKEKETSQPSTRRCPHCRSLIRLDPSRGKTVCPVCGRKIVSDIKESAGIRKILDLAKSSFKNGEFKTSLELYQAVKEQSPKNKEALFYIQKLRSIGSNTELHGDVRNVPFLTSESPRLDQLLGGGVTIGDTILVQGPPFCGKELLLDQIMASALKKGVPVIYVSSNRAMKEVMRGIIKKLPDFKRYNHEGMVRMYDLFSKHKDDKILKEGHRIFNIEERDDFKRFQNDLVFVQEELVKMYHGGLMIINSLSPLISQVDQNDLMKFLQVLISRSKSYRFTNILDIADGVHAESVENSIEYLMDGIMEFKESETKNTIRLKGFNQNVMSRDWMEYVQKDDKIRLVGSFMEERIL